MINELSWLIVWQIWVYDKKTICKNGYIIFESSLDMFVLIFVGTLLCIMPIMFKLICHYVRRNTGVFFFLVIFLCLYFVFCIFECYQVYLVNKEYIYETWPPAMTLPLTLKLSR